MHARARRLKASLLPSGWLDATRQVVLFALAYFAYGLVRGIAGGASTANAAFAHARDLISLERALHVFVEPSVQSWAAGSHALMEACSWLYVNAQGPITIGALMWLYMRHNGRFYFVRNMFLVAFLIALVGYVVFPTAPPRFLPEWGFTDPVGQSTGFNLGHSSATMEALFNPYAAVPSMHVAFAAMIGWPLARVVRSRWVAAAWLLYPLLMTFVIVVTANHFLVDALLGAFTAVVATYAASALGRVRPAAWRFGSVTPVRLTASG